MQKRCDESETLQQQEHQRLHAASECDEGGGLTCLTSQDALSCRNDVVASPRCGFEPSERELRSLENYGDDDDGVAKQHCGLLATSRRFTRQRR
jgi:hypothetical protein